MKLFELQSTVIKWVISIFVLPDVPTKCEKRPFPSKKFVKLKWFMGYSARIKCFDYFGNKLDDLTGEMRKIQLLQSKYYSVKLFLLLTKIKSNVAIWRKIHFLEFTIFTWNYFGFLVIWRILKIRFHPKIRQIEVISALFS